MRADEKENPSELLHDVIIAGGGLAGLTAAIILARRGFDVLLLEKNQYPRHKVCGEYISNEVRPLLESLGLFPSTFSPTEITRFQISGVAISPIETKLKLGGFGISRYQLDQFLFEKALESGVKVKTTTAVTDIQYLQDQFKVQSYKEKFLAKVVIAAHGKRSLIDKSLKRDFIRKSTDYIAIKQHYRASFPSDLVSLHNFEGGYAGLSMVENNIINMCLLTRKKPFSSYANIQEFTANHISQNKSLNQFLSKAEPVFDKALVISQVNFDSKAKVEDHVLMCGDSAGLIHPLCGNGMSMAIHAAALCSVSVTAYLRGAISRNEMEEQYRRTWQANFKSRLRFGRIASRFFGKNKLTQISLSLAKTIPNLMTEVVSYSHGKSVNPQILEDV